MKSLLFRTLLFSAAVITAITPALSQAQHTLKVPFSFQIGKTLYPAGSYGVKRESRGSFVVLEERQLIIAKTYVRY